MYLLEKIFMYFGFFIFLLIMLIVFLKTLSFILSKYFDEYDVDEIVFKVIIALLYSPVVIYIIILFSPYFYIFMNILHSFNNFIVYSFLFINNFLFCFIF